MVIHEVKCPEMEDVCNKKLQEFIEEFNYCVEQLDKEKHDHFQNNEDRFQERCSMWDNKMEDMIIDFDRIAEDLEKLIEDLRDMHL